MAGLAFEVTVKNLPQVEEMLQGVANGVTPAMVRGVAKGSFRVEATTKGKLSGEVLKVRTGRLRNSVTATAPVVMGDVVEGRVGTNVIYARIHELGGEIVPKNGPYLVFQVSGRWVRTKHVTMPKRPFLQPSLDQNRAQIVGDIQGELAALVTAASEAPA